MSYKWKKEQLIPLLKAYRDEPILWSFKKICQVPKIKREEAYLNIVKKLGIPGLQAEDVNNKVRSMRNLYKTRRQRVLDSIPKGEDSDGIPRFVPELFWYKYADEFLRAPEDEDNFQKDPEEKADESITETIDEKNSPKAQEEMVEVSIGGTIVNYVYQETPEDQEEPETSDLTTYVISDEEESTESSRKGEASRIKLKRKQRRVKPTVIDEEFPRRDISRAPIKSYNKRTSISTKNEAKVFKAHTARNSANVFKSPNAAKVFKSPTTANVSMTPKKTVPIEENEFDLFGKSIAIQLKKMPLQKALTLQEQVQALVNQHRLAIEKEKNKDAIANPCVSSSNDSDEDVNLFDVETIEKSESFEIMEIDVREESDVEEIL